MSDAAGNVARQMLQVAETGGLPSDALTVSPELAEAEKKLFVAVIRHFDAIGKNALSIEEISSVFTFFFAKAAEAATDALAGTPVREISLLGLLDGKAPLECAPEIALFFHGCSFPSDCAETFLNRMEEDGFGADTTAAGIPLFLLLEALKWEFRIAVSAAFDIAGKK